VVCALVPHFRPRTVRRGGGGKDYRIGLRKEKKEYGKTKREPGCSGPRFGTVDSAGSIVDSEVQVTFAPAYGFFWSPAAFFDEPFTRAGDDLLEAVFFWFFWGSTARP